LKNHLTLVREKTKAGHGGAVIGAVLKWGEIFGISRQGGKARPAGFLRVFHPKYSYPNL